MPNQHTFVNPKNAILFPYPTVAFCERHLLPFKPRWPEGYGILCLSVMGAIFDNPVFRQEFPRRLDAQAATELLIALSPLCCLLGDHTMKVLTIEALAKPREV